MKPSESSDPNGWSPRNIPIFNSSSFSGRNYLPIIIQRGAGNNGRMPGTVVVLTASPDQPRALALPPGATIVAADGGAEHAQRMGLHVDLLVGDLDSVSEAALARAERVDPHPTMKDATDLELALAAAVRLGPEHILVVGGSAGRLDHLLGAILVLAGDPYAGVRIDAQLGDAALHV